MQNKKSCAYVAITTEPKALNQVFRKLEGIPHVKQVHTVAGRFDIVLFLEGETPNDIFGTVVEQLRGFPGVLNTETWPILAL